MRLEVEQVRAENRVSIERLRAELLKEIAEAKASQIRWAFLFWVSQMAMLIGILFQLLK